jgi:KaiC/GvpD/RAD55 family RecA-like ATPase
VISLERVKTGIPGFDELIEGGIPKGFNILLVGQPGTGKTSFGLQYLVNGAMNGENGIYVSLDSPNELVKAQARQFGWDVDALEKEGKITFLKIPLDKPKINLFDMLEEEIKAAHAERLVFDSLADFAINIDQFATPLAYTGLTPLWDVKEQATLEADKEYRYETMATLDQDPKGRIFYKGHSEKRVAYLVVQELAKLGTTNMILTDAKDEEHANTVDGVSEYVCDGVVVVYNQLIGAKRVRTMTVLKMRSSDHSKYIHDFEITKEGIKVKPAEEVYK